MINALKIATVLALLSGSVYADVTTVTAATGVVTQFNYSDGFVVGTNTLLTFPTTVCGGISSLAAAGNSVTYSGTAVTHSSGWETVTVTSFTNNTTSATYTKPTPGKPAAFGPESGTIKQLNYSDNGSINGFLLAPSTFVELLTPPNATLAPLLKVGATVSVTGTSEAPILCAPAGAPTEVVPSSLTIGTTIFKFGHDGH